MHFSRFGINLPLILHSVFLDGPMHGYQEYGRNIELWYIENNYCRPQYLLVNHTYNLWRLHSLTSHHFAPNLIVCWYRDFCCHYYTTCPSVPGGGYCYTKVTEDTISAALYIHTVYMCVLCLTISWVQGKRRISEWSFTALCPGQP